MGLVTGWRARAWFVWRSLADPRDALALGGRALPMAAYAIAGPFLALGRLVRRQGEGSA